MDRSFRSVASFGKRQEFIAISELLKREFDVYVPLVDDQQIDCVVRRVGKDAPAYVDVQIKARSKHCSPKNAGLFAAMTIVDPRPNYYFIFYSEQASTYWVIPSLELIETAYQNKTGKNKGKYTINLARYSRKTGEASPNPKFAQYENNFELLEKALKEATQHGVSTRQAHA